MLVILIGAGGRTRTDTLQEKRILSPSRLPVPPHPQAKGKTQAYARIKANYNKKWSHVNCFVLAFSKISVYHLPLNLTGHPV